MILFTLLLSIANADNFYPVGKEGANTTYAQKEACETREAHECFEISKCQPEVCSVEVRAGVRGLYEDAAKIQAKAIRDAEEAARNKAIEDKIEAAKRLKGKQVYTAQEVAEILNALLEHLE